MTSGTEQDEREATEELELQAGRRAPYTMTPDWVLLAPVSRDAKVIYWALAGHVNQRRSDDDVWPTQQHLAKIVGYKKAKDVRSRIQELVAIDAIEIRKTRTYDGMRPRSVYTVHQTPPDEWDHPTSLKDFYQTLKEAEFSQVTPKDPAQGPSKGPAQGPSKDPAQGPSKDPHRGLEPDQLKPDEVEPDQPANRPADAAVTSGMVGWLGTTPNGEKTEIVSTEGRDLLRRWGVTGAHLDTGAHLVEQGLAALGRSGVVSLLTDNLGNARNPAGVIIGNRLPALKEQLQAATSGSAAQIRSGWCLECDPVKGDGGRPRCPDDCPNYAVA